MDASIPFSARLANEPTLSDAVSVDLGLWALPLRTPTLPPALATNTVFVGKQHPFIVDPATPHANERARLLHAIAVFRSADRAPVAIVLTHHHPDHVGAAAWLRAETGLPIMAHIRTAELLPGLAIDHTLVDGQWISGSDETADRWRVDHTPGHASGHIALHEPERGLIIGGDLLASVGTIVVDPPDGHMATYLATLERVRDLESTVIVPSHGAPIGSPDVLINHYIAHRLMREERIFATLSKAPTALAELTRAAYAELNPALLPLARRSALAHLQKLCEDGRAAAVTPQDVPVAALAPDAHFRLV